jgi:transaldolase
MNTNPLLALESFGQSIWMDYISRGTISSGQFQQWVEGDGVSGVTSNPSIFAKAITESGDYDESIRDLILKGITSEEIFRRLSVQDIQSVADILLPTYLRTDGRDGFVSIEVSPRLAYDTNGTIEEARELWVLVNRPNAMIKVPATSEGIPAIRELTGEGINVNITLLFGLPRYQEVADAYISGLEMLAAKGKPLKETASVASFFLSRIDALIDPLLEEKIKSESPRAAIAERLHGEIAIASAKVAYEIYRELFSRERFMKLANKGARTQKLLWASTSTKNPAYKDTKYVEALIGPETINTVPIETLNAYRDHGHPEQTLDYEVHRAYHLLNKLSIVGIDLDAITQQLEDEGVEKFVTAYDHLMTSLRDKAAAFQHELHQRLAAQQE